MRNAIKEAENQIDMYESMILYNKDFEPKNDNSNYEYRMDFLKTAISAMQELQELHEQGISLERLKDIDFRKQVVEHINYMEYMAIKDELEEYRKIGTLEEVRESAEKQNKKSPTYDGDGYAPDGTIVWDEWLCPHCGSRFEVEYEEHDYCPNCGQHILWEESDEQ